MLVAKRLNSNQKPSIDAIVTPKPGLDLTRSPDANSSRHFFISGGTSSGWNAACQPHPVDSSWELPVYSCQRLFRNSLGPSGDLRSFCKRLSRDSERLRAVPELAQSRTRSGEQTLGPTRTQEKIESNSERARVRLRGWLPWAITAAALAAALVALVSYSANRAAPPETRLDIATPPLNDPVSFALSPDGRKIAYTAMTEGTARLWVRPLDSASGEALAGTEGALFPFWSPDSRSLGFSADGKLKRVNLDGSALQTLAEAPQFRGAAWNADGVILFAPNTGSSLFRVSATGGLATPVARLASETGSQRLPRFCPAESVSCFIRSENHRASIWDRSKKALPDPGA
jgi:hypothetical protein